MSDIALIAWVITVFGGLFLLAIWLIEYDPDFQRAAATRLPVPVISGHATLALAGLGVWVTYLITDDDQFAWATLAILAAVLCLGLTMAVRWVAVYRASARPVRARRAAVAVAVGGAGGGVGGGAGGGVGGGAVSVGTGPSRELLVPPERHFPLPVVIGHGVFAFTTIVLVLLTTLGVGGS